jgi:HNH endonuclease
MPRKGGSVDYFIRRYGPTWPEAFYDSRLWQQTRRKAVVLARGTCQLQHGGCGMLIPAGASRVDHIQPLREHPHLAIEPTNLRVLCLGCHNARHGTKRAPFELRGADCHGWPIAPEHPWNRRPINGKA